MLLFWDYNPFIAAGDSRWLPKEYDELLMPEQACLQTETCYNNYYN